MTINLSDDLVAAAREYRTAADRHNAAINELAKAMKEHRPRDAEREEKRASAIAWQRAKVRFEEELNVLRWQILGEVAK